LVRRVCGLPPTFIAMSTPQDYKQSAMEQWITRKFSWVRRASSTSQYPDVPDDRPTTAATDVPSTSVSRPLPVSPVQETSCVDLVQLNDQPGLTGIGEHGFNLSIIPSASQRDTYIARRHALDLGVAFNN
jgi:hypothetical protein